MSHTTFMLVDSSVHIPFFSRFFIFKLGGNNKLSQIKGGMNTFSLVPNYACLERDLQPAKVPAKVLLRLVLLAVVLFLFRGR